MMYCAPNRAKRTRERLPSSLSYSEPSSRHACCTVTKLSFIASVNSWTLIKVADAAADYATLGPQQLAALLRKLEQQMYKHAQDLEFEDAARLRDEIQRVKSKQLVS